MPPVNKRMYTPESVAKYAHYQTPTIYRYLNEQPPRDEEGNPLPHTPKFPNAYRVGNYRWFIPEEDVIAFLGFDPTETTIEIVS